MKFITIKESVETEIVEKKSKFIANLFPVQSLQEAEEIINNIKKKYHDARHNCVAYRVIENGKIVERASDDGEPSGTAGAPMLNILQKNNLTNLVIIVTRYFGGILLGTGGLLHAYSDSLMKAIKMSQQVEKFKGIEMLAKMEYTDFDYFKYYCKNNDIFIRDVKYMELIECKIELEDEAKQKLLKNFETKKIILKNIE